METQEIGHIDEYIKKCLDKIQSYTDEIIVYRGETQDFGKTACIPGLFRKRYLDENKFFEKNILDEMTANGIAIGNTYLEKAINAQHDGFPSRLLDVTYNSLIGLQFAVTPYYKCAEDSDDDKDGYVYIFHFSESYCATGIGISDNYDEILNQKETWYNGHFLFSRNFKFIDHMRINERIKAQNGAFILFQGNEPHQIPNYYFDIIKIPRNAKKTLRMELKTLFDIDNSTIYPEAYNLVEKISNKSLRVKELPFNLENELEITYRNLDIAIDEKLIEFSSEKNIQESLRIIRSIERDFLLFKKSYELFKKETKEKGNKNFINKINDLIDSTFEYIELHKNGNFKCSDKNKFLLKKEEETLNEKNKYSE